MAILVITWVLGAAVLASLLGPFLRRRRHAHGGGEAETFVLRFKETVERLRPEIEVLGPTAESFGVAVRVAGQEWVVPLGELYLRAKVFPGAFEEACRGLLLELEEAVVRVEDHPFDEAAASLLPQVRTLAWVRAAAPAFGPGALAYDELFDGLVVCFVLDDEDGMIFVTRAHLEHWGVGVEAVRQLAETNLRRLAGREELLPTEADRVSVVRTSDGYANSRLLLALRARQGGLEFAFAIPDRDTLLLARPEAVPDLIRVARESHDRAARPISPAVFGPVRSSH